MLKLIRSNRFALDPRLLHFYPAIVNELCNIDRQ